MMGNKQSSNAQRQPQVKDLLIKRCHEEPSVRNVENDIIRRMNILEQSWCKELDLDQLASPVLVFCVHSDLIEANIRTAIREIDEYSPMIVVVLHCINDKMSLHDLDLSYHDDCFVAVVHLMDLFDRLVDASDPVHFAFSEAEGLYPCDQNKAGFRELSNILKCV